VKEIIQTFYQSLTGNEQKTFWFGAILFALGFLFLLDVLRPPSWSGWQETQGRLVSTQHIQLGQFNAGQATFQIEYTVVADGQMRQGMFHISPIVLSTMKRIRVFYQKNDPSVFYVHNPTRAVIATTLTILGTAILLTFYLYYRDRLKIKV
jgi:hypothetical protein